MGEIDRRGCSVVRMAEWGSWAKAARGAIMGVLPSSGRGGVGGCTKMSEGVCLGGGSGGTKPRVEGPSTSSGAGFGRRGRDGGSWEGSTRRTRFAGGACATAFEVEMVRGRGRGEGTVGSELVISTESLTLMSPLGDATC